MKRLFAGIDMRFNRPIIHHELHFALWFMLLLCIGFSR